MESLLHRLLFDDERSAPRADLDDATCLKPNERLTHRHARLEAASQCLRAELRSCSDCSGENGIDNHTIYRGSFVQGPGLSGLHTERVCKQGANTETRHTEPRQAS
jgi:hypothetical protein